jgi:SOS response regulatory protein OraA/RecX|tara:strand:+ start:917 stop:1201 length:285 start_codon:yes stop_codon:yes gene_type:complete
MERDLSYLAQIKSYIRKNLKKGYTKESLYWALVNQGHSKSEIEKAFKKTEEDLSKDAPVLKTKPKITYERIHADNTTEKIDIRKKPIWKRIFDN